MADLLTKPLAGPKQTKFVRMLLHHYTWWNRGGLWRIRKSLNLYLLIYVVNKLSYFLNISQRGLWVLMISQCYPVGFGFILYSCQMRKALLIWFLCAIQVGKKFPHWLEGSVKQYSTWVLLLATCRWVSKSMQVRTMIQCLDKRSRNYIFMVPRLVYYRISRGISNTGA